MDIQQLFSLIIVAGLIFLAFVSIPVLANEKWFRMSILVILLFIAGCVGYFTYMQRLINEDISSIRKASAPSAEETSQQLKLLDDQLKKFMQ